MSQHSSQKSTEQRLIGLEDYRKERGEEDEKESSQQLSQHSSQKSTEQRLIGLEDYRKGRGEKKMRRSHLSSCLSIHLKSPLSSV